MADKPSYFAVIAIGNAQPIFTQPVMVQQDPLNGPRFQTGAGAADRRTRRFGGGAHFKLRSHQKPEKNEDLFIWIPTKLDKV